MAKAEIILQIRYNKRKTDPEALAQVVDRMVSYYLDIFRDELDSDYGKLTFLPTRLEPEDPVTWWKFPQCKMLHEVPARELPEIGTPFCPNCGTDPEGIEMEPYTHAPTQKGKKVPRPRR